MILSSTADLLRVDLYLGNLPFPSVVGAVVFFLLAEIYIFAIMPYADVEVLLVLGM